MYQERNEIEWHSNWMSGQFKFLKNSRAVFSVEEQIYLKGEIGHNRPINRRLAIDNRDYASVDRNSAIKSHPFDHKWKAEMSPRF